MNIASLSQYAKHKDGTYVELQMNKDSKQLLDHFVEMNLGLSERVDPDTYHITVIYSRTPVPNAEIHPFDMSKPVEARVTGYEVFPTKNDGKCLVMRINCPFAVQMNDWMGKNGATSDYDKYKPHITIAYDMKQEIIPESLPIPEFPLMFDRIDVKPLDPEFVPANK